VEADQSSSKLLLTLHEPNLMVTPHVAWASHQSIEEFRQQLLENLEGFAAGTPRNVITALDVKRRSA
jgi:glycerate dehydrogenase